MRLLVLWSVLVFCHAVDVWPAALKESCGIPESNETLFSKEGHLTLNAAKLCTSYDCRYWLKSSFLDSNGDASRAFETDLRDCALPPDSFAGLYNLMVFSAWGLNMANNASFMAQGSAAVSYAIAQLHAVVDQNASTRLRRLTAQAPLAGVVSPLSAAIQQFQYSVEGTLFSRADTTAVQNYLTASLTESVGTPVQVSDVHIVELKSSPEWRDRLAALVEEPWFWAVVAALCVYLVLMCLGFCGFGPPGFKIIFACWPEVCEGKGCPLYRIVFCPFVLLWHACRIFIGACCYTYFMTICKIRSCEGCCWSVYDDPEFPPSKWQMDTQGDTASGGQGASEGSWARACDIAKKCADADGGEGGAQLFHGDIEPSDMLQGAIADCWLIAGLACVAERPEIIQSAILTPRVTPHGKYRFRLWNTIRGEAGTEWLYITIDDKIPVHEGTLEPLFARSNHNEMWAMLMEKAFAKMYGGYKNLELGQMWWPITAITGNHPITIRKMENDMWVQDAGGSAMDQNEFFLLLKKLDRNGAFMSCADVNEYKKSQGLINGHAYSVLRVVTVGTSSMSTDFFRMIRCRNPWGSNEWKGKWSDKSDMWDKYPYVKSKLHSDVEDGAFWMQWEDFCEMWEQVQIVDCNTDIHTVATPIYDEHEACGPVWSCIKGCFNYWCCCTGFFHLYCGRRKAASLEDMKQDLDNECGVDQSGVYCKGLRRKPAARTKYHELDQDPLDEDSDASEDTARYY